MSDPITRLNAALDGRYQIEREIGVGGMATVYLADDIKHERKVALKVLKPELAAVVGAERFLTEIKTTANLQHPHILPLHDSGEADGFLFYVMPFIEGETLADRLARDKQLPVEEAVKIATDVAEALHAAHQQGVIHRDVKPANILLSSGRPLVADFGIALAVSAAGGGRLTETGLSMGTPYYMSPEQAAADREPSPASDVYSLGCVLYEMLVGEPPHTGSSAQAVLAKILTEEAPDATKTRAAVPANVDAVIRKSLQKLPADRFTDAQAFANALADRGFGAGMAAAAAAVSAGPWKTVAIAATAVAFLTTLALGWSITRSPEPGPVTRHSVLLPGNHVLSGNRGERLALAPDGSAMVYLGSAPGEPRQLWWRPLDQLTSTPLPGTEEALNPAFSPDGSKLVFVRDGSPRRLMVATIGGGPPLVVEDSLVDAGGVSYGYDGYIYYDGHLEGDGIARVPEGGGTPEIVTMPRLDEGENYHNFPRALPNGRGILFSVLSDAGWSVAAARIGSREHTILVEGARGVRYSPTGHLLYVAEDGSLIAAPFDQDALELTGAGISLLGGVELRALGRTDVELGANGTLVYTSGATEVPRELVWVTREGVISRVDDGWAGDFSDVAVSPDGTRLAITLVDGGEFQVWVKRLDEPRLPPRLLEPVAAVPVWALNGEFIDFLSDRSGSISLYRRPTDGSAPARLLLDFGNVARLTYSPDGRRMVFSRRGDLFAAAVDSLGIPEGEPVEFAASPGAEIAAAFSPDGRWLAFSSNASGSFQVFVCPMPGCEVTHLVSAGEGVRPGWAHDGRQLFYQSGGRLMAVEILEGPTFQSGVVRELFQLPEMSGLGLAQQVWDVAPDGGFVMIRDIVQASPPELIVVENFLEELKARVPN